ncbi:MAG: hypothetical protein HN888_08840, partial [Desulfobacula sp.]|nr:hypothetical protein [Desulfobacula sp.]
MTEIHSLDIFEQKRKRKFFIPANSLGMIFVLVFSVIDYLEGDTTEFLIDILIAVGLIFSAIGIFKFSIDRIVYIIGINLLNVAILYNVSIGAGGGMVAILMLFIMPLLIFFFLEITESIVSIILFFSGTIILLVYPSLFGTFDYGTE